MATENVNSAPVQQEDARALAESTARSMRESAGVLQTVEQLAQRLLATGNEQAAASEQVRSAIESVAGQRGGDERLGAARWCARSAR